jgi:hypothetical protein
VLEHDGLRAVFALLFRELLANELGVDRAAERDVDAASTLCGTTVGPGIRRFWGRYMFSPSNLNKRRWDSSNDASPPRL